MDPIPIPRDCVDRLCRLGMFSGASLRCKEARLSCKEPVMQGGSLQLQLDSLDMQGGSLEMQGARREGPISLEWVRTGVVESCGVQL